jgi:hypothetical protein
VGIVPGVLLLIRTFLTVFVQLLSPRARLVAENLVLRQQLIIVQRVARRPRLKPWERRLLSAFALRWTALQDAQVWACDFFTIVSVRFRVLYGFVILSLERRKIVHVGVTEHPTAAWAAQRVVEAIGDRVAPRYLLHDRDMIYGEEFRQRVRGLAYASSSRRHVLRGRTGLRLQPPIGQKWLAPARPSPTARARGIPILGGLHHRYGTASDSARLVG